MFGTGLCSEGQLTVLPKPSSWCYREEDKGEGRNGKEEEMGQQGRSPTFISKSQRLWFYTHNQTVVLVDLLA